MSVTCLRARVDRDRHDRGSRARQQLAICRWLLPTQIHHVPSSPTLIAIALHASAVILATLQ
jgi:hypothetical protein